MSLTTLAQIKAFLNVPATDTSQDTWLTALQVGAEATVKTFLGQQLESATYTRYYSGTGTRSIILRELPVTSITSVHLDENGYWGTGVNAFASETLLAAGTDYALQWDGTLPGSTTACSYSGLLVRLNTVWQVWPRFTRPGLVTREGVSALGNVKVIFEAGYLTIPADIQTAVATLVGFLRKNITTGGIIGQERIGDYSYELWNPRGVSRYPELGTVRALLNRYRDLPW